MNRYQRYIFGRLESTKETFIFSCCRPVDVETKSKEYSEFDEENDLFTLKQNEDITKTKYIILFGAQLFSNIFVHKNNEWAEAKSEDDKYSITLDFEDRIDEIKFVFNNNLADDYVLKIKYVEADKKKYYAKQEQNRKEELLKIASIKVSTGASLVNVYFQPCCDKYDHTEVSLFIPKEQVHKGYSKGGEVIETVSWSLIKKCKVPVDDFFSSINGLAYGEYSIVLKQFDKDNNVLLETDHISFKLVQTCVPGPEFMWG